MPRSVTRSMTFGLYGTMLTTRIRDVGAVARNRRARCTRDDRMNRLRSASFTTRLTWCFVVGAPGFEPGTSASRRRNLRMSANGCGALRQVKGHVRTSADGSE
jgi:hypothetical protein